MEKELTIWCLDCKQVVVLDSFEYASVMKTAYKLTALGLVPYGKCPECQGNHRAVTENLTTEQAV